MAQNKQYSEPPVLSTPTKSLKENEAGIEVRKVRARRKSINNRELIMAAGDGKHDLLEYYIKEGANVNFQDRDGNTPLHWAIESGKLKAIELLLHNGALNIKNNGNETPLSLAKRLKNLDALKILQSALHVNTDDCDSTLQANKVRYDIHKAVANTNNNRHVETASKILSNADNVETCNSVQADVLYQHEKRGSSVHGNIYQLKVLMLFLKRGLSKHYSFSLGTEIREANKFDDLVFEYTQNGRKLYHLLQAKHKLDESKKISASSLLANNNGDYSLIKYYLSYENCKKEPQFKNGTIEDVTVCTNIDFDFNSLKSAGINIEKIESTHDILDVKSAFKQPARYKFGRDIALLLKKNLRSANYSLDGIIEFLNHLVFAVNQPNEEELGMIIKEEIGREFDFVSTENVYNKLFVRMLNWLQGKGGGRYLSYKEGEQFFEEAKRGIPVLFNIKAPVKSFTGRTRELDELHKMLQDGNEMRQIACICGLGGVGKSELARKYITIFSENYDNKIVWINAESYESLAASFRRLASDKLNIRTKNANGQEKEVSSIVEDVYMYFIKQSSLFVFDNAEKYTCQNEVDSLKTFLPSLPSKALHVLITSRNQKWPKHVKMLQLNVFNKSEAIDFLKNSLEIRNDMQTSKVTDLATLLGYMPLALQQAVSYISKHDENMRNVESQFTIEDYIVAYGKKIKECLNFNFSEHSDNCYIRTVYTTWNVTLDMLSQMEGGNNALEILNIVSYLAPEDISTHFFSGLLTDPVQLGSAISLLSQYSLINVENAKFSIHRLLQEVIRLKIQDQHAELHVLRKAFKLIMNKDNVTAKTISHAISIWNHSQKYSDSVMEFAPITSLISCELLTSGRSEEAYSFGLIILNSMATLSRNDPAVLLCTVGTQHNIAMALLEQGKCDKALEILRDVHKRTMCLGYNHTSILVTQNNIARGLAQQGNYSEALQCYKDVYACKDKVGCDHEEILSAEIGIAAMLMELGEYTESMEKLKKVCRIQEQTLGKTHTNILESKNTLAGLFIKLRNYDEALELLLETYNTNIQKDESRKMMFTIMWNIATLYLQKGDFDKALQWYNDHINAELTVHGKETPSILQTRSHIASILEQQGKCSEALKIRQEVLEVQNNILGPQHDDTIATQYALSEEYVKKGDVNKAVEILEEVLQKKRIIYHSNHPTIVETLKFIVVLLQQHKKFNEAFQYNQQVLDIQVKTSGENGIDTLITKTTSGVLLCGQNKHDKAFKILQDTFDTLMKLHPQHSATQRAKENIGLIYLVRGQFEDALTILREVFHARVAICGKDHIETVTTKGNIAKVLLRQRKTIEALKLLHEVYAVKNSVLGPQSPQTLEVADCIEHITKSNNDLFSAVSNNNGTKTQELLTLNGDANSANTKKGSLLHYAVNNDNSFIVQLLLKDGADIMHVTGKGNTPLHIAVSKGLCGIVQILLEHAKRRELRCFVDVQTTISGSSALHIAAKCGFSQIVKKLLAHGATYNLKNKEGNTPLVLSKNQGVIELLQLTEELFQHATSGNTSIIRKLQRLSYDDLLAVTNSRIESKTALQVSIINKQAKFTKMLINLLQDACARVKT